MQNIHRILTQNGISPTWVDSKMQTLFSLWLEEATKGETASFDEALRNADTLQKAAFDALQHIQAHCCRIVEDAIAVFEKALSSFSHNSIGFDADRRTLTRIHLQLLNQLVPLHHALSPLLDEICVLEEQNENTLLFPQYITEMTLRRIALQINGANETLLQGYDRHAGDPLPGEQLATKIDDLRKLVLESIHQLSNTINTTSDSITAINQGRAALTEYINLLRRLTLTLHDVRQKISTKPSEV